MTSVNYNEDEFWSAFEMDLRQAKARVILQSAFLSPWRLRLISKVIDSLSRRNVIVCAFIQEPFTFLSPQSDSLSLDQQFNKETFEYSLRLLRAMNVHVNILPGIHYKFAVIDDRILYQGSLNILSHNRTKEHMMRTDDQVSIYETTKKFRLDECEVCAKSLSSFTCGATQDALRRLGQLLLAHRTKFGLGQQQLAARCSVGRTQLRRLETGENTTVASLLQVTHGLGLQLMFVPTLDAPAVANFLHQRSQSSKGCGTSSAS